MLHPSLGHLILLSLHLHLSLMHLHLVLLLRSHRVVVWHDLPLLHWHRHANMHPICVVLILHCLHQVHLPLLLENVVSLHLLPDHLLAHELLLHRLLLHL